MLLKSNIHFHSMLDELLPTSRVATDIMAVVLGSLAVVLSAQIYIPLPFTPVPITAQTFAILTISSFMGSKRAPLAVLLYVLYGVMGFSVFADGKSGITHLLGATGGYILGFMLSAYVVGLFCERGWDRSFKKSLLAMFIGQFLIFVPGLLWLGQSVGYNKVLELGFYPFVIGGIVKTLLGATTSVLGWSLIEKIKKA